MNHLIKKLQIGGGGGKKKPKPQPATLTPPKLGVHKLASSFSFAEILDLISDGPIEGLVNKNNSRVEGINMLQGIYLDDTPVAVTDDFVVDEVNTVDSIYFEEDSKHLIINSFADDLLSDPVPNTNILSSDSLYVNYYFRNIRDNERAVNQEGYVSATNFTRSVSKEIIQQKHNSYNIYFLTPRHNTNFTLFGYGRKDVKFFSPAYYVNSAINSFGGFANLQYSSDSNLSFQQQYINNIYINNGFNTQSSIQDILYEKTQEDSWLIIDASELNFSSADENTFINNDGKLINNFGLNLNIVGNSLDRVYNFSYPKLDNEGKFYGQFGGFIAIGIKLQLQDRYITRSKGRGGKSIVEDDTLYSHSKLDLYSLKNLRNLSIGLKNNQNENSQKYNYTNILTEIRKGEEFQEKFENFNKVYIDKDINSKLFGPFRVNGEVQRIAETASTIQDNYVLNDPPNEKIGLPINEGSNDDLRIANKGSFSNWDQNDLSFNESAISYTHIVENPNVEFVFVTIGIENLSDTLSKDIAQVGQAGTKYPGVVNLEIEIGKIDAFGNSTPAYSKTFQIVALCEGGASVDIGSPDAKDFEKTSLSWVKNADPNNTSFNAFDSLILPSALDYNKSEETPVKRYVKVTKLSTETNSILIRKDISLQKITEIIPVDCTYPFSAIAGIKFDSRTFGNIPTRTYDVRLKKIQIPNNYFPTKENVLQSDKRYYNTLKEFSEASEIDKQVYVGDWDGSFTIGWTDNPAWILYDLLTNARYGLGQYINEEDINKWDLYKIGRFCDAVDEEGYFVGVPDGRGGLEPRFSCNIYFEEGTKVFDAINVIANLFRGSVFYNNNEINFLDDRLRDPIALFTNSNVKDGLFSYVNYRRDEQFNAIEVVYIDRYDNFKTKIEYIEDEEDIVQRGVFKKQVNGLGVTSRAMANRIGKHLIYQTIQENQSVTFNTGLEALLCKPGDLILIEDELKSLQNNFGRILKLDNTNKTIRINENYSSSDYTNTITVYAPTGQQYASEVQELAETYRERVEKFTITGRAASNVLTAWTGLYRFSGYSEGFDNENQIGADLFEQFPVYTGNRTPLNIIYYSTLATGWVFAQNQAFTNNNTYDKYIAPTSIFAPVDLNTGYVNPYDAADTTDRRTATSYNLNNAFDNSSGDLSDTYRGVLETEINLISIPQIINLSITGHENYDDGSLIYIDQNDVNSSFIPFIPEGSAYRIQRQNADDQIYKVMTIREDNPNEYQVVATKYDSGKYDLIENSVSIEFQSDTFGYGANSQVNDVNYITLDAPIIIEIKTGASINGDGIYISGKWNASTDATGYNVIIREPNQFETSEFTNETEILLDGFTNIGTYVFAVNALGDASSSLTKRVFDSDYSVSNVENFVIDTNISVTDNAYVSNMTIN